MEKANKIVDKKWTIFEKKLNYYLKLLIYLRSINESFLYFHVLYLIEFFCNYFC
jgi:hypothetical protein